MNKKILSLILALTLVFAFAVPVFAEGEETTTEDPNAALYAQLHDSFVEEGLIDGEETTSYVDDGSYTAANGYSYFYMAPLYNDLLLDTELNPHQYERVWDFAGLLSDSEEASLNAKAEQVYAEKGVNTYYLTYDNACGVNETKFTDDFYDYYITKLDFDNEVDGILYAVDMDNRQIYINTAGEYADKLSSNKAYDLLDKTYSYASNGDYYTCLTKTDDVTMKYLFPTIWDKVIPTSTSLIISVVVAIIVVIALLSNHKKDNKAPVAKTYLNSANVLNRNAVFMGHREEVIHDFYKQQSSGGGSHSSGGGGSHGGGGHGF